MGSNTGEARERPVHKVTITKPFWLGKYPVTQAQYQQLMGHNPFAFKKAGSRVPVEQVSWNDAMAFCRKLNERERAAKRLPAGYQYSLPNEAQWEYACRAGTTEDFSGTGNIDTMGWHLGNSKGTTQPVGRKRPNAWGLYDMHGNVWELCLELITGYPSGEVTDPEGPASDGGGRIERGGSWEGTARLCRSAFRGGIVPDYRNLGVGFRLALIPVR